MPSVNAQSASGRRATKRSRLTEVSKNAFGEPMRGSPKLIKKQPINQSQLFEKTAFLRCVGLSTVCCGCQITAADFCLRNILTRIQPHISGIVILTSIYSGYIKKNVNSQSKFHSWKRAEFSARNGGI